MAEDLSLAYQGEGSGLARVVKPGIQQMIDTIRIQNRDEAARVKAQQDSDAKKLAALNKELEKMKVEGWSQDRDYLSGLWTDNMEFMTNTLKTYGQNWNDPTTESGRKNYSEQRRRMQNLALQNSASKEHKKYFDEALKKFQSGGYTSESFEDLVKWKDMPLDKRMATEVPILKKEPIDWRSKYTGNQSQFTNKFSTDTPQQDGDYIETAGGTYIDKKRLQEYVDRMATNRTGNRTGQALFDEAYQQLIDDPQYNEGYTEDELTTLAEENAKQMLYDHIVSQISTESRRSIKAKPGAGTGTQEQVLTPQEGEELTLLQQQGYGKDVKLYNDPDGNLIAYSRKNKTYLRKSGDGWTEVSEDTVDAKGLKPVMTRKKTSTVSSWDLPKPVKMNISTNYYLDSQGNYHQFSTGQTIRGASVERVRTLEYVEKPDGTVSIDVKDVDKEKNRKNGNVKRGKFAQASTPQGTVTVPYDAVKNDVEGAGYVFGEAMGFPPKVDTKPKFTFGFDKKTE